MNRDDDFALRLAEWLEDGPFVAPQRGIQAAIDHARTHPRARIRWPFAMRRRGLPGALSDARPVWLLAALIALLLLGAALAAGSRLLSVAEPACPRGAKPDLAGPVDQLRPPMAERAGPLAWDEGAGRLVVLARTATGEGTAVGSIWSFDVCTNTWRQELAAVTVPDGGPLVYDEDSGLTVAIGGTGVWTYDLPLNRWTRMASRPPELIAEAVYEPDTGLIIGKGASMWAYDVEADAWRQLRQQEPIPAQGRHTGFELITYDRSLARVLLTTDIGTWLFDPRTGAWLRSGRGCPIRFYIGRGEIAWDDGHERTLVYGEGMVAAYDAATRDWDTLFNALGWDALPGGEVAYRRLGYALAYDPLNDRLVVSGGLRWDDASGWRPVDDVIAFDLETRRWMELLAPSEGG